MLLHLRLITWSLICLLILSSGAGRPVRRGREADVERAVYRQQLHSPAQPGRGGEADGGSGESGTDLSNRRR